MLIEQQVLDQQELNHQIKMIGQPMQSTKLVGQQKTSKAGGKVRRTRQARNPQLSVARRNERERNRVKMVNNGFALLRDHLPVEYLQLATDEQTSEPATPDVGSNRSGSSKARKFSKVETLRAAIQHIKTLQQVLRATEPDSFDCLKLERAEPVERQQQQLEHQAAPFGFDELDGPLSVCEPLSCASSSSATSRSALSVGPAPHRAAQVQHIYPQQQPQEHFIKLEPQQRQVAPTSPNNNQPHQHNFAALNAHQSPAPIEQQSHTHLWIQQHQNSFVEQQQQQHQQQTWYASNCSDSNTMQSLERQHSPAGSEHQQNQQQQQQQVWFGDAQAHHQQQQRQPEQLNYYQQTTFYQQHHEQQHLQHQQQHHHEQQQQQQQQQLSPVGSQQSGLSLAANFAQLHHHQISLYSQ